MAEEEPPQFDLDDDGGVTLSPVVTLRAALFAGMTCGLRIEYQSSRDRNAEPSAIQLALTPEQSIALSQLLRELAQVAMQPPHSRKPPN